MKWMVAAGGLAFVGLAFYRFLSEASRAAQRSNRPLQPWEDI